MNKQSWLNTIRFSPVIAVVRTTQFETGLQMARAVVAGGIHLVEVTWNSDRAAELVRHLRREFPEQLIGAGTLLTMESVEQAIAAGSQFLFTPHVNSGLIQVAAQRNVPLIAGALTPTEILTAWQAGAASVKVFPVQAVGGVEYIRSLQGPLGDIPLIPTGGVTLQNTGDFLQAGAAAVGLSGDLFPAHAIQTQQWSLIAERAAYVVGGLTKPLLSDRQQRQDLEVKKGLEV